MCSAPGLPRRVTILLSRASFRQNCEDPRSGRTLLALAQRGPSRIAAGSAGRKAFSICAAACKATM